MRSLLDLDPNASVIVAGDMNEYLATRVVLRPLSAVLHDANEAAGVPPAERYTYAYDQNAQEIDHVFVSDAIAQRSGGVLSGAGSGVEVEHVHVNTWAETIGSRASDHDPTVVRLWVCDPEAGESLFCGDESTSADGSGCSRRVVSGGGTRRGPWPNHLVIEVGHHPPMDNFCLVRNILLVSALSFLCTVLYFNYRRIATELVATAADMRRKYSLGEPL